MRIPVFIIFCLTLFAGCASLKIDTSGSEIIAPLCVNGEPKIEAILLWGTLWRPNQKEPLLRESMAKQGIEKFISETQCVSVPSIQKIAIDKPIPSNQTLIEQATTHSASHLLFVLVRELGPTLEIGIPSIIEGHTEVVLETRIINLDSHKVISSSNIHWRQGGKFIIKSTKSLPNDMASALHALLIENGGYRSSMQR